MFSCFLIINKISVNVDKFNILQLLIKYDNMWLNYQKKKQKKKKKKKKKINCCQSYRNKICKVKYKS